MGRERSAEKKPHSLQCTCMRACMCDASVLYFLRWPRVLLVPRPLHLLYPLSCSVSCRANQAQHTPLPFSS